MIKNLILKMENIEKSFPGVKALDKVNLNVYRGRVMALMGENGAGKSTLMKVLTGVYEKDAGEIFFNKEKVEFKNIKESQEKGIAIIHQELNLIPNMSITENIFLGRELTNKFGKIDWKLMNKEAKEILKILEVEIDEKSLVRELSVGKMQMVEIAKALSQNAKLIVMDEPTDSLTEKETESLFKVIKKIISEGRSVIYISHRMKEIPQICDDITIMRDGKFIVEKEIKEIDEDFIIEKMVGRKLEDQFPRVEIERKEKILEVKNLNGEFSKNVSFDLYSGEVLGVAGLMGAGRTEIFRTIFGYLKKDSGSIEVFGKKIEIEKTADAIKNGIIYVSEDRKKDGLIQMLNIKDNMSLSSLDKFTKFISIDNKKEKEEINRYVGKFSIKTPSIYKTVKNLSGGNQQKVALAKALMTEPKILFLDEPTRGIDVGAKKEIYDLINDLKRKGMGIVCISSDMAEVIGISDRIMVIHENKVKGVLEKKDFSQENIMKLAIGVESDG